MAREHTHGVIPADDEDGRIVALDYGRRRVGVATSDPSATIASPRATVDHPGDPEEPPAELLSLLEELSPTLVVVGIPRHMDGSEGEMAKEARSFGRAVAEAARVTVVEWDERLTTAAAEQALVASGAPRRKRGEKGARDKMAAALLLKSFLASRR